MFVAELCAVEHEPFVGMRPQWFHVVLHGEVAVGGSGAVVRIFVEVADDGVLHVEGETTPCPEFREGEFVLVRELYLFCQFGADLFHVGYVAEEPVAQFGDDGEQRDFIEGYLIHEVAHLHVKVMLLIPFNADFLRVEVERRKPFPVERGKETAGARHEPDFFGSETEAAHGFHFFLQGFDECVGIFRFIPVLEREGSHGVREQFDISVRGRKLIQVGI